MPNFLKIQYLIDAIKKLVVTFLTRNFLVVTNRTTHEYFIVSHITQDGYISLLMAEGTYLPVSYSVFKRLFKKETTLMDSNFNESEIEGIEFNSILLSSGEMLDLADLNDSYIEDSLDTSW
jgi:hypothetical protein